MCAREGKGGAGHLLSPHIIPKSKVRRTKHGNIENKDMVLHREAVSN